MTTPLETADDVCALPLARRMAALLGRDPSSVVEGAPLARGWHVMLFNAPTPQAQLRKDGAAHLGVTLPDIGLPRLMMGGRQIQFQHDVPIGARVRRETRQGDVQLKQGRSGRFALVKVEHSIFVEGSATPALVETTDYVLREASPPADSSASPKASASPPAGVPAMPTPAHSRTLVPDERMLFRYSAITDNPHRIHYDLAYATAQEGYPALVVNGSLPAMFLLELFRSAAGREPASLSSRNAAPMFCGRALTLCASPDGESWRLWTRDATGQITYEARVD